MFAFFKEFQKKRAMAKLKEQHYSFLFEEIDDEYVVFDTETTGLNPKEDEILSIGAVKVKGNKILTSETFEFYVKNEKNISSKSIEIHRIRPCDLEHARSANEVMRDFLEFIRGRTLVGYYLEFDVAMVNKYILPLLGIKLPNKTIEISELYYDAQITTIPQGNIDLRFDTILKKCDIPNMGVHNAVNDAVMSAMVFLKLKGGCK
ncbi:MAG: 3'-5' exonuclease [Campylobacterales bacterium]|nr:3'-5' exonuclease [Campylobacterales bacterium]